MRVAGNRKWGCVGSDTEASAPLFQVCDLVQGAGLSFIRKSN